MALPQLLREDNRREPVEGETFSSNPAHPYWRVKVRFTTGLKPSIERIRAATASQALEFVCARYPFASRSGSEVLGRWDAEPIPIDPKVPVEKPAPTAPRRSPMPTRDRRPAAPLQPLPTVKLAKEEKPVLGADLERLPRDRCGRAVIDESVIPRAVAANDGGLSWPVIADMLGCGEKNLRERAGKWRKQQEAEKASRAELEEAAMAKECERLKQLATQEIRGASEGLDRDVVAAGWRKVREAREFAAPQAQQGVTVEELSQTLSCPPGSHGSSLIRANWLMGHPKIGPLLRGEHAPKRVVLPEEPPDPAFPPSFGAASYFTGYRAAWAKAYAEVERQQGGQAPCWAPAESQSVEESVAKALEALTLEPMATADPTDARLWDVFGPQQRLLASRQPSELSCRLMTVLGAAGVSCSRSVSEDQPTTAPVITPTKAGGFMVQVTVNPLESGG